MQPDPQRFQGVEVEILTLRLFYIDHYLQPFCDGWMVLPVFSTYVERICGSEIEADSADRDATFGFTNRTDSNRIFSESIQIRYTRLEKKNDSPKKKKLNVC